MSSRVVAIAVRRSVALRLERLEPRLELGVLLDGERVGRAELVVAAAELGEPARGGRRSVGAAAGPACGDSRERRLEAAVSCSVASQRRHRRVSSAVIGASRSLDAQALRQMPRQARRARPARRGRSRAAPPGRAAPRARRGRRPAPGRPPRAAARAPPRRRARPRRAGSDRRHRRRAAPRAPRAPRLPVSSPRRALTRSPSRSAPRARLALRERGGLAVGRASRSSAIAAAASARARACSASRRAASWVARWAARRSRRSRSSAARASQAVRAAALVRAGRMVRSGRAQLPMRSPRAPTPGGESTSPVEPRALGGVPRRLARDRLRLARDQSLRLLGPASLGGDRGPRRTRRLRVRNGPHRTPSRRPSMQLGRRPCPSRALELARQPGMLGAALERASRARRARCRCRRRPPTVAGHGEPAGRQSGWSARQAARSGTQTARASSRRTPPVASRRTASARRPPPAATTRVQPAARGGVRCRAGRRQPLLDEQPPAFAGKIAHPLRGHEVRPGPLGERRLDRARRAGSTTRSSSRRRPPCLPCGTGDRPALLLVELRGQRIDPRPRRCGGRRCGRQPVGRGGALRLGGLERTSSRSRGRRAPRPPPRSAPPARRGRHRQRAVDLVPVEPSRPPPRRASSAARRSASASRRRAVSASASRAASARRSAASSSPRACVAARSVASSASASASARSASATAASRSRSRAGTGAAIPRRWRGEVRLRGRALVGQPASVAGGRLEVARRAGLAQLERGERGPRRLVGSRAARARASARAVELVGDRARRSPRPPRARPSPRRPRSRRAVAGRRPSPSRPAASCQRACAASEQRRRQLVAGRRAGRLLLGLGGQPPRLRPELREDVLDPGEVRLGLGQLLLGLAPAALVAADAGDLLEQRPALLGPQRQRLVDHALADEQERVVGEVRGVEQVDEVAQPDRAAC